MRETVIDEILAKKIIVIIRGAEKEKIVPILTALRDAGVTLAEVTFDASRKIPASETAAIIRLAKETFGDTMRIGAGTVLSVEDVETVRAAGGEFIISPDVNEDVIRATVKAGMVSIPGALTPSEITCAHRAGADFIKLFPVGEMGLSYVKAVRAPLNHIRMLAVGGVKPEEFASYEAAGICGFGIGSGIVSKDLIAAGDFDGIRKKAEAYVNALSV